MPKYIECEAFKSKYLCCGYLPEMSEEEFDSFPAAAVAPVVRCKDCQNCQEMHGVFGVLLCMNHLGTVLPDDFCSYGKRKDEPCTTP